MLYCHYNRIWCILVHSWCPLWCKHTPSTHIRMERYGQRTGYIWPQGFYLDSASIRSARDRIRSSNPVTFFFTTSLTLCLGPRSCFEDQATSLPTPKDLCSRRRSRYQRYHPFIVSVTDSEPDYPFVKVYQNINLLYDIRPFEAALYIVVPRASRQ